jgi:diguanylate cyclase (GGDEF)-like protein
MQADIVQRNRWRFSSRVLLPILVVGVASIALVAGVLFLATRESDQIASERQSRLVSHALAENFAKITRDQESVSIWDEAVQRTLGELDLDWFDANFGIWLYDYFGHDRTYVLDANNKPIYGMMDGERADPSSYTTAYTALSPLVKRLREDMLAGKLPEGATSPSIANLVMIEARPAIASIVPIVSDTGRIVETPGSERLHVSIRFLDGSFLEFLGKQYLLSGPRFAWNDDDIRPDEAGFPLRKTSGTVLGYFVWQPERPGGRVLTKTAPALGFALFLVGAIVTLLVRQLRRASSELQASEAQAQHLAFHDPLTGLPNRTLFFEHLDRSLIGTRRDGARIALLYLDLDRFKNVNDTLGHSAGDDLIRELGERLISLAREKDCVARLGGDEFAILQGDVSSQADVAALCERIIQSVSHPFEVLGNAAFVGVSIGVAIAPDSGMDRADLMRKADIALYRAKFEGRNRFRIFSDEMDLFVQQRRRVEAELREALASGDQLKVVYQPLYATTTGSMCGIEALLRWNHPEHGIVSPGVFVPIAEESGLIHKMGDWVLREACRAAKRWPVRRVAVNVSPVQFRSALFATKVLDIIRETGLEPYRLELEITESVLLDSAETALPTFNTLRGAGVRIALDDFGTGYSSLTYLQKFPVDKIKIDRAFVHNLDAGDGPSNAIVQAIVDLARAMGVEVTAEGVETEAQRDALKRIGCDELQGFLFSRPLNVVELDNLLGRAPGVEVQRVATAA